MKWASPLGETKSRRHGAILGGEFNLDGLWWQTKLFARRLFMKNWIRKVIVLSLLFITVPLAQLLQRLLSEINEGDGEITSFAINHMVAALPTLVGFCAVSLLVWWFRDFYSKQNAVLSVCYGIAFFGALNFVAEVVLESASVPESDDATNRVAYPYIQFKGAPDHGGHNRLGYGGSAPEPDKKEGEYRILVLGGSTVRFGNPSVAQLLEEMFKEEGLDEVRVFNIGVSGSNTGMELARLVFEMPQYEPDLVVSYSGGNDINLPLSMDPRPGFPYNFMIYEHHPLYTDDFPTVALTAYSSYLLRLLGRGYFQEKFSQREQLRQSAGWNTAAWRDQIAEAYVRNMEMTAKVSWALGSDFAAFLQPMLLSKKTLSTEEQNYLDIFAQRVELPRQELVSYFNDVRDGIATRLQAEDGAAPLRYEDLSSVYDSTEMTIFPDFIHTGPDARRQVTQKMFETLREIRTKSL